MMRILRSVTPLALVFGLGLAACEDYGTSSQTARVSVLLTDEPANEIVEAWVTITDIYLQGQGGEADPPGGRVYLMEGEAETHELLSLANAVATLVEDEPVPVGTYGQLRMVLSGGCIVTGDGSVYATSGYTQCGTATGTLMMPSMAQSGLKVNLNGLDVPGGQTIVLLDFHVEDSFGRQAGNSGMWVMTPVVHAATVEFSGGIEVSLSAGEVELPEGYALTDFSATLLPAEGDTSRVSFGEPDDDDVVGLAFSHLIAGSGPFQVRLNAPDGLVVTVAPASPATVSLVSGEVSTVDWVLQSAELEDDGS